MKKAKTILIIDDSNTSLMLLEWTFKSEGFNTLVAENVMEAKKIMVNSKPDLILLDLFMPKVSGYEFLKMRSELNISEIPVIIVSAYDSEESVKQTKELGAAEFIAKPFNVEQIINAAKKYLL